MKRRELMLVLGGAVTLYGRSVRARQGAMSVIGSLGPGSSESDAFSLTGFRQGLREARQRFTQVFERACLGKGPPLAR